MVPKQQRLLEANMIKKLAVSVLMLGSSLAFAQPYRRDFRYERPVAVEHRLHRERADGYYDQTGCWHAYAYDRR
jgi:hypothetical protein